MALVYSCCFWFSLRLGGIIIALISCAFIVLILFCVAQTELANVKYEIESWISHFNLIYTKEYLEDFLADPTKYFTSGISLTCVYIATCIFYIYGAFTFNNIPMLGYILVELIRLVVLSVVLTTWLLVLKQNTMDIGLLIGASVAGAFILVGMFYLWVCSANLPILINEMEHDEQETTIAKLQQLVDASKTGVIKRDRAFEIPFHEIDS